MRSVSAFKEYELGAICSRLSSGKNIPAKHVSEVGNVPVYGGNGLRGYTERSNFEGECAIIGRQGVFCGNVRYYTGRAYMTEHAVVVCAKPDHNTRYLSYVLAAMNLGRLSAQSAQPGLSVRTLAKQIVSLPTLEIQKKVVAVISSLESKIEDNNRINDNLEQQAFALFNQLWLEADGIIPLSAIAEINPKRSLAKNQPARCIEMTKLPTNGAFPSGWEIKPYTGGMRFSNGDTLLARITPCLENGKTAYINILDDNEVAFGSTEYIVLSAKEGIPSEYLYCLARQADFIGYAVKNMNGSSGRQRVSAEVIGRYHLPNVSAEQMEIFWQTAPALFLKMKNNFRENLILANLRDSLLPRLMSGEIDVSQVQV